LRRHRQRLRRGAPGLPDGGELRLAACVVADVGDGRIVRMREYVDSAAAAGLLAALSAR
jgi:ketosteroid isomerase-like protein